jgi:hypothetical protein
MSIKHLSVLAAVSAAALLSACGSMAPMQAMFSQNNLPEAVKVPTGFAVAMETVGVGTITYECRDKANAPGMTEWVFVGPNAVLNNRSGKPVGKYFGPPATWEAMDGSKLTATQLAVAPGGMGNIPLQLVKANPAMGMNAMNGAMAGVSHIQRVATMGGVAPASMCSPATKGAKEVVKYQADYIFWKAI